MVYTLVNVLKGFQLATILRLDGQMVNVFNIFSMITLRIKLIRI